MICHSGPLAAFVTAVGGGGPGAGGESETSPEPGNGVVAETGPVSEEYGGRVGVGPVPGSAVTGVFGVSRPSRPATFTAGSCPGMVVAAGAVVFSRSWEQAIGTVKSKSIMTANQNIWRSNCIFSSPVIRKYLLTGDGFHAGLVPAFRHF